MTHDDILARRIERWETLAQTGHARSSDLSAAVDELKKYIKALAEVHDLLRDARIMVESLVGS